jgi:hypothetical protein
MTIISQVQQCPIVTIAAKDDMSATTAVATIGATIGVVLHTSHVCTTTASLSRAAVDLYIVYEVGFSHKVFTF